MGCSKCLPGDSGGDEMSVAHVAQIRHLVRSANPTYISHSQRFRTLKNSQSSRPVAVLVHRRLYAANGCGPSPPASQEWKKRYSFEPSDACCKRRSPRAIERGGSCSFFSPDGFDGTNHTRKRPASKVRQGEGLTPGRLLRQTTSD